MPLYKPTQRVTNTFKTPEVEDRAQRFLEQNQEYVRQLKERAAIEKAQDQYYYKSLELAQAYERSQVDQKLKATERDVNLKGEIRVRKAAAEYRAQQLKEQLTAAKPGALEKVTKLITEVAPAVAGLVQQGKQAYYEEQKALGQADYLENPFKSLGPSVQARASNVMAAEQDSVVGYNEITGGDPVAANELRQQNLTIRQKYYYLAQAEDAGTRLGPEFYQATLDTSKASPINVSINGQLYPINQLPNKDPNTMHLAFKQYAIQIAKTSGYTDALGAGVAKFYEGAEASYKPIQAMLYKQSFAATKSNDLNTSQQLFQVEVNVPGKAAGAAQDLFQAFLRNKDYDFGAANKDLISVLSNPTLVNDAAFAEIEDELTLAGRPKPFSKDRPLDWEQIKQDRKKANSQLFDDNQKVIKQKALAESQQLAKTFMADMSDDGDIDISPEQKLQMEARFLSEGVPNDPRIRVLESFNKYTASEIQQADQVKQFDQAILNGSLTVGMITRSSLSAKKKTEYLKKVQAGEIVSISPTVRQEGKNYIYGVLKDRAGDEQRYLPIEQASSVMQRATTEALNQWTKDYIAATKDPKTASNPIAAANSAFEARVQDPNGQFQIYSSDEILQLRQNPEQFEAAGRPEVGNFKNSFRYGPSNVAFVDPKETIVKMYEKSGADFITQPQPDLVPSLNKIAKDIALGKPRMDIPPIYVEIAERYNTDPMSVIETQFKVNGIEYDENFFKPAKEAVQSINPVYNQYLYTKPQVETTDAALIGSGQTPVYQEMPAIGAQTIDIIMSRESPIQGYEAMNNGTGGDSPGGAVKYLGKKFEDMTLQEVLYHQNVSKKLWAAGAFQFVPNTLPEAMQLAGVTKDMKFTPQVQRAMFWALFDRYGPSKWNPYWSNKATSAELEIMRRFQQEYDYSKPTWMQSQNLNPALATRLAQ